MIDLEQLQILSQLVDRLEISASELEKGYNEKNLENFNKHKQNILNIQKRISQVIIAK
ncbi:MAG: hypothetical protein PHF67_02765 [Candidatus Nanoarchaeia archaeon]|nr:hypothetical protein [Candidatus Nanoarchaeia archaeon]